MHIFKFDEFSRLGLLSGVALLFLLQACGGSVIDDADPPESTNSSPTSRSYTSTTKPTGHTQASSDDGLGDKTIVRCNSFRLPTNYSDIDLSVDKEHNLVTLNYSDTINGTYTNVHKTVSYKDDETCRSDSEVATFVRRAAGSDF